MKSYVFLLLQRYPRLKAFLKVMHNILLKSSNVSSRYIEMPDGAVETESVRLRGAWQDWDLPMKQRELVDRQLADYRVGLPIDVFDVLVEAMHAIPKESRASVLEVGCSSGFYSEVFKIAGLDVNYVGADYSDAFIKLAQLRYPALKFDLEDATAMRYRDNAFDVVISGCCLLHIPEYEEAVAEVARVARTFAIFHRTPVVLDRPNRYFRKLAYGVETIEIHFNEQQFLDLLRTHSMELVGTWNLSETPSDQPINAVRTYLCRVVK